MAYKQLVLGKNTKAKYQVRVPVFRVPSDKDYEEFSKDPAGTNSAMSKMDEKTQGTHRFYASLRYPDDEVAVDYSQK